MELSKSEKAAIAKDYKAGASILLLASKYQRAPGTIKKILVEQGATIRQRGRPRKS